MHGLGGLAGIANALTRNGALARKSSEAEDTQNERREARKGRNPRTGKEIDIAASTSPVFRGGKSLKDSFGG